jgi:hypothetical protein
MRRIYFQQPIEAVNVPEASVHAALCEPAVVVSSATAPSPVFENNVPPLMNSFPALGFAVTRFVTATLLAQKSAAPVVVTAGPVAVLALTVPELVWLPPSKVQALPSPLTTS